MSTFTKICGIAFIVFFNIGVRMGVEQGFKTQAS